MELVASAWISSVTHTSLDSLWKIARESAAVSRSDFHDYFDGTLKLRSHAVSFQHGLKLAQGDWPDLLRIVEAESHDFLVQIT